MKKIIEMNDIHKAYQMGSQSVTVLKGVSLDIYEGELVAILGPSGSGKSTLMNILGCIDTMDSGTYFLDGEDINDQTDDDYSYIRNQKIGFVFQKFNLINKYTALYNVALPLILGGSTKDEALEKAEATLESVGLGDRMHHKPLELSGGQQQRVAVARALVNNASLILADEPTGNLDSTTGEEIMSLFSQLNDQGHTILIITHDLEIANHAKRIIHVKDGIVH